ncbi:MAG: ribonuclease III [Ruminiclostridium sp.]|nr:ribonuclease III [Ruminiclostridium sp.]MBQ8410894.1 ribonuclease III [Ruminiclostridium sp.]
MNMEPITKAQAKQLSPLTLAFYGDCVYEMLVRRMIVIEGSRPSNELHRLAVEKVRASFQSAAYEKLLPILAEEETDILKRGRNATGLNPPKSSNPRDYHRATAVEVLFGYLDLIGEKERIEELFEVICREEG